MSIEQTTNRGSARFSVKRPATFITAGLLAAALAVAGGPLAASAASGPTVTPNVSTASAAAQITLTGSGFQADESVTVTLDGAPAQTYPETVSTDDNGAFNDSPVSVYLADTLKPGSHTITVTGSDPADSAQADITVVPQPTITVSPASLTVSAIRSTGVTAKVSGFTAGTKVQFGVGGANMGGSDGAPVVVASDGTATHTYTFAAGNAFAAAGTYTVSASSLDFSVVSQAASYTVVADPAAATPATPVKTTASFTG